MSGRRRQGLVLLTVLIWGFGCGWGLLAIHGHQTEAGRSGRDAGRWPPGTSLCLEPEGYTLLLFAHPRCPCLRSTLQEIARVVGWARRPAEGAYVGTKVGVRILAFAPRPDPTGSRPDSGWSAARARLESWAPRIVGARVIDDIEGLEAKRFGAATSGDVLLFDRAGRLVFRGGVTRGRAVEGESESGRQLLAILRGGAAGPESNEGPFRRSRVYGCPILSPEPSGSD